MSTTIVMKAILDSDTLEQPVSVLLVDDQKIVAEAIRRMLEDTPFIKFHYCSDPLEAIDYATKIKPTVILQDLVMPDIDGLTLVRYYRANPTTREIPLIVLSTKEDSTVKAAAFLAGANDYLVKLPDKAELVARLKYHSKCFVALQERNAAYEALRKELANAGNYIISTLPEKLEESPKTDWCFQPSLDLGGDNFTYHWIDEDNFSICLLDVCGHGVGAALLSVSVVNVLRTQSLPDTDFLSPASVLTGLNQAFKMEDHNNMFFTIWYGIYNRKSRTLTYSSGGHPPALLLTGPTREEAVQSHLSTSGFIIGAMPDVNYSNKHVELGDFSTLFVFSDGVYEIQEIETGKMWTLDGWMNLLNAYVKEKNDDMAVLVHYVQKLQGREQLDDDFSLLQIDL